MARLTACIVLAATGCAPGPGPAPVTAPPDPAPSRTTAAPAPPASAPAPPAAPSAPAVSAAAPPAAPRPRTFPPPAIAPPHSRSASPGDGLWTPLPEAPDRLAVTVLHPHQASRFMTVHVVAIDLSRTEIGWLPGTADVDAKKLPGITPGLVPEHEQDRLLAVFNGGFQPMHGRWGMRLGEHEIMPPRDTGCTIALAADGGVKIAPWPEIAGERERLKAFRQTPPCMMSEGRLHPKLLANDERPWGGNTKNIVTRRRSAVGLDPNRGLLFYALGIEVGPRLLTEALRHAGAAAAAELDINFNWTRFLLFGRDEADGALEVARPLLPDMPFSRRGHVTRKNDRDFFYVLAKPAQTSD